MTQNNSNECIMDGISYKQSDFFDVLYKDEKKDAPTPPKKQSIRIPLPKNQQVGFRHEYDKAMITLYIIGLLLNTRSARLYPPKEITREFRKAKKVQKRYERYMPHASLNIIHFGREVADAYVCGDQAFLNEKESEAYNEARVLNNKLKKKGKSPISLSQKQKMFNFTINKIECMIDVIRQHNTRN